MPHSPPPSPARKPLRAAPGPRTRRLIASVLLVLVVAVEYWLSTLPMAADLENRLSVPVGSDIVLAGIVAEGPLLAYSGGPGEAADIRFDRARLAPETMALFQALGIDVGTAETQIAWITGTESGSRTVFEIRLPDAKTPLPELRLRALAAVGAKQPQLEVEAQGAALQVVIGTPLAPEEGAARSIKRLTVGDRTIRLPGALPLTILVPPGSPLRARLAQSHATDMAEFQLGGLAVTASDGSGLRAAAIGIRKSGSEGGGYDYFACAAPAGSIASGGVKPLVAGRCASPEASIAATHLAVKPQHLELSLAGAGWSQRGGKLTSADLLSRVAQNRVLAGVLVGLNVVLVIWLLLELFGHWRRARGSWSGGVFISYRRKDSASQAGRLYDHLVARFGKERVFMDVDTIAPGEDFVRTIRESLAKTDTLLAVIGREWLQKDAAGARRIDAPEDHVRTEIAIALAGGTTVIPVLVGGASMP
ncbi:MAG: toll/interleukin-1 receptor domain-containing protein, partial [Burkholderiales bacterium]